MNRIFRFPAPRFLLVPGLLLALGSAQAQDLAKTNLPAVPPPAQPKPPVTLKVPVIFSDHMVLQRDIPVPVWGTATPVSVSEGKPKPPKPGSTANGWFGLTRWQLAPNRSP